MLREENSVFTWSRQKRGAIYGTSRREDESFLLYMILCEGLKTSM
jgi:hypothetical protein